MKARCNKPVKGAMKDIHFVERFSFCSTEGDKGCQAYKVDIRYLIRNKNSFESRDECFSKCRGFGSEEIKQCNSTESVVIKYN